MSVLHSRMKWTGKMREDMAEATDSCQSAELVLSLV